MSRNNSSPLHFNFTYLNSLLAKHGQTDADSSLRHPSQKKTNVSDSYENMTIFLTF